MRLGKVMLLAAAALAGCNETTGPEELGSRVLLEIEYINYAWTPTYKGFYLDASGNVYSYDREGAPWEHGERSTVTAEQLQEKFSLKRTLVGNVDSVAVTPVAAKINLVNKTQLSATKAECADAGILTYRAYNYNASKRTYEPILLRVEGDFARQNTSTPAQELIAYIRSLGLFTEMLGCDP